jgi:hypothetical protein
MRQTLNRALLTALLGLALAFGVSWAAGDGPAVHQVADSGGSGDDGG